MSVTYQDVLALPISEHDILQAIEKAQQCRFVNNLRQRHANIEFDCKIRGFIGETALKNWLATKHIYFQHTNYLADESGIDVDFSYPYGESTLNLELKTSLIPDEWRNLPTCIDRGDIKLIRRGKQTIEQLRGDIHLQIYFRQRRKAKDRWLSSQRVDIYNWKPATLYNFLLGRAYLDNIFLVGWVDKPALIENLTNLPIAQSTWQFSGSGRKFWKCNIARQAYKPLQLVTYLQSLPAPVLKTTAA
jgi:hypothetical protein